MSRDQADAVTTVVEAAEAAKNLHPELRAGQTLFNALYELHPDIANEICGESLDPFHHDDRVPEFLRWLATRLATQ